MPNGAFEVAENLFQNSTGEHEFRAAASRAYYATFQHLIGHVKLKNFRKIESGEIHRNLIEFLKKSDDETLQRIGHRHLFRLRAI